MWNSELYDSNFQFVSDFGKDLISILNPEKDEIILDLGSGTGDLTNLIDQFDAKVLGIDSSLEMINKAKSKYPKVNFKNSNIYNFSPDQKFDAVFTNAVLHWINDHDRLLKKVHSILKENGRFVGEFGGMDTCNAFINEIYSSANKFHLKVRDHNEFWNFPSPAEFGQLLEKNGFKIEFIQYFKRPTDLDGKEGVKNWIEMFGVLFFSELSTQEKFTIIDHALPNIENKIYHKEKYFADYIRLRFLAIKK